MLGFLHRCRQRLDKGNYDPTSPFYRAVAKAYDAIHSLHIELHYQSIGHGVGEPPRNDASDDAGNEPTRAGI